MDNIPSIRDKVKTVKRLSENQKQKVQHQELDWTPDDIRPEKIISAPTWACYALIWATHFFEALALLDVRHCPKLQSYAISRKTNDANLTKWQKP